MADGETGAPRPGAGDAAAAAIAMNADASTAEDARLYLREQTRLARLQSENLIEQNAFELSHLKWRRFNDQMKGALQIMAVAVGALLVFGIGAAVWSAAHDDGVVIEAFDVPPDMAARGLNGSVISSMLLDKLTALQSQIDSARAPSSYASKSDDIKVLIPDTGISISEAYRYLVGWLGHQTHISGDVYRSARGITVVVRTSGNPGASFEGGEDKLNDLMEHAAESVYRQTQPFRYAVHLLNYARNAEADEVLNNLVQNGPASEKPWAYAIWMYPALSKGDLPLAIARARTAAALDPHNLLAQANVSQVEAIAGHDEEELRFDYAAKRASAAGGGEQIRPLARIAMEMLTDANIAEETGDYFGAIAQYDKQINAPDFNGSRWSAVYMKSVDLALAHDVRASRRALGGYTDRGLFPRASTGSGWNQSNLDFPQYEKFAALGDWAAARKDIQNVAAAPATTSSTQSYLGPRTTVLPRVALSLAKTGDMEGAWRVIAKLPMDCYFCLRVRGQIAAEQRNWDSATHWFARAVALAPSIPFAYSEWGAMLMHKGDLDGAIAKFESANKKGPHFADPLEMWGEALIARNRSDLALAKFEKANRYAPNWGRLHLKWGEALWWSGKRDDAKKQFAAAAHLDLTPNDRSILALLGREHG